jgi:YggT family protein
VDAVLVLLIHLVCKLVMLLIFARALLMWLRAPYYSSVAHSLVQVTEPLLGPLRRLLPPIGGVDLTPLVAIVLLWVTESVLVNLVIIFL